MTDHLRSLFPNLADFSVTSPRDDQYNCIAWAAGNENQWWWPDEDTYWPLETPETYGVAAFVAAFSALGYEPCESGGLEDGFEKVAIYALSSEVTHMARQLPSGRWTSKLGELEDIEHSSPVELEGDEYGTVAQYMKRAGRPSVILP